MTNPSDQRLTPWQRMVQAGRTREQCGLRVQLRRKKKKKHTKQRHQFTNDNYQQLDLRGNNVSLLDPEEFGDTRRTKDNRNLRIIFQNIRNLHIDNRAYKSRQFIQHMAKSEADVFAFAEVGLHWPSLDSRDQWFERTRGQLQERATLAYNTHQVSPQPRQYGGTGISTLGDARYLIKETGRDPSGLGRWCWTLLEGKQHHTLRVVSLYRPVLNSKDGSVHSQHTTYLRGRGDMRDPLIAAYEDLGNELDTWLTQDRHIIVGLDANEDIRTGDTKEFLKLEV